MTDFDYQTSTDKDAMLDYANSLDLNLDARFNLETIREKILSRLAEQSLPEQPTKQQKTVKIMIHKTENDTGSIQVPVSVQGKTWLIKRGHEVEVPVSVVEVLKNAIKEIYEFDGDEIRSKEVPAYPFSVVG